jgi:hypothetical protein
MKNLFFFLLMLFAFPIYAAGFSTDQLQAMDLTALLTALIAIIEAILHLIPTQKKSYSMLKFLLLLLTKVVSALPDFKMEKDPETGKKKFKIWKSKIKTE